MNNSDKDKYYFQYLKEDYNLKKLVTDNREQESDDNNSVKKHLSQEFNKKNTTRYGC